MAAQESITNSEEALPNVTDTQLVDPGTPSTIETPAPMEIGSLGEAMQAFNAAKSKAAETLVPEGEATGGDAGAATGDTGATPATAEATLPVSTDGAVPVYTDDTGAGATIAGGTGEPASYDEVYDADAGIAEVRQQLTNIAVEAVRKEFASKDIKKISINDLIKVDERSGTKEFINPDTNRPFSSSNPRSEAQAFVKDYNEELNSEFIRQCQALMPNIEKSYAPVIEFHQFLPRWQEMDPFRQEMFEELVAGHELKDRNGNIVAYNCDLNAISDQMERQIQWLLTQQKSITSQPATQPAVNEVKQPAVAAKTKSPTATDGDKQYDLSNMSDALKYFNQQKRKKK